MRQNAVLCGNVLRTLTTLKYMYTILLNGIIFFYAFERLHPVLTKYLRGYSHTLYFRVALIPDVYQISVVDYHGATYCLCDITDYQFLLSYFTLPR